MRQIVVGILFSSVLILHSLPGGVLYDCKMTGARNLSQCCCKGKDEGAASACRSGDIVSSVCCDIQHEQRPAPLVTVQTRSSNLPIDEAHPLDLAAVPIALLPASAGMSPARAGQRILTSSGPPLYKLFCSFLC